MPTSPFDAVATEYDSLFENNPVTQNLRQIIWKRLSKHFQTGDHILDLNCGTGTDAIKLAGEGIRVTAIDSSVGMIDVAEKKILAKGLNILIELKTLRIEMLEILATTPYDGALSNFGGLNCIRNLPTVIENLSKFIKPGKMFIACILNRISLWEIASFLLHGKLISAFRRLQPNPIEARLGGVSMPLWYYSPNEFQKILSPWFTTESIYGLNIISPPPNSNTFITSHPSLTTTLLGFEARFRSMFPFYAIGDHFVIEARRRTP